MNVPLFLDVDGVLNVFPYNNHKGKWEDYVTNPVPFGPQTFKLTISRQCCAALHALPVDIHWLTTWGPEANNKLSRLTQLPELPVLGEMDSRSDYYWKYNLVEGWAEAIEGPARFIWIDDDAIPNGAERSFPDALLIRTDPTEGITPEHIEAIQAYVDSINN